MAKVAHVRASSASPDLGFKVLSDWDKDARMSRMKAVSLGNIRGMTTANTNAIPVLIDSAGPTGHDEFLAPV